MRATVLLDRERPKVDVGEVREVLLRAGLKFSTEKPEIGVVIGGDGVFSYYGRMKDIPLLFVGYFDELENALVGIRDGRYTVVRQKRLEVRKNGRKLGEVFTDVYLQRGIESNGLRYRVEVSGGQSFGESAIGDGVAICTRAGSTGYYSYPDKIKTGDWLESGRYTIIGDDEIGVCHIVPTFTTRDGSSLQPLRYTVPWESRVIVRLVRDADARLYGVTEDRRGVSVGVKDVVMVLPSRGTTRLIRLEAHLESKP